MPWQRQVALVGGEIDPDSGLPAYRNVVVTVPRQNGKTTLVLAWEVQRALGWGRPQRIVYSAQTGADARKKLLEDQFPILEPRKSKLGIQRFLRANGHEAVVFKGGSRLVLMASGEEAGHGKTVDLGIKDELFADVDYRRDQALIPAMATRADGQVLTASTAGTDASIPLNEAVALGRQSVTEGRREGVAYFEWSAEPDADPNDPEVWWGCMPALGLTISEAVVQNALDTLPIGEFRRAFLNIPTRSDERVIPSGAWDLVNDPNHAGSGSFGYGIDANPERSAAAILSASEDRVFEVIEHRPGLSWLVSRCVEIDSKRRGVWAYDGSSGAPIASFVPDLERAGLQLVPVKPGEMPAACGAFYDGIVDQSVRVRRHPSMDAAVAGAEKRLSGDAWTWARRGATDICPLVAATVALRVACTPVAEPGFVSLDDFLEE